MVVRVMVFGDSYVGPTYNLYEVGCTSEQYNNGEHYEIAKDHDVPGFTAKFVADENDHGMRELVNSIDWTRASTLLLPGGEVRNRDVVKPPTLQEFSDAYIRKTYETNNYNKSKTAEVLGVALKTVYNRLKAMGINRGD